MQDGDQSFIVSTKSASNDPTYNQIDPPDVVLVNRDNEAAGVTVTPTLLIIPEGQSRTFTVVLNLQPTSDVFINLRPSNSEATIDKSRLTFTSTNWDIPQTVRVTAKDDLIDDPDANFKIILDPVLSSDASYNGIDPADVDGVNLNDDNVGIAVNPVSGLTTSESGATTSFTVKLNSPPTADVTVTFTTSDASEGLVSLAGQSTPSNSVTLTFTPVNYSTPQTVTVIGQDDTLQDGDQQFQITSSDAVSTDAKYDGLKASDVTVTNVDDEVPGFRISPLRITTTESGGTATFTVRLNVAPTSAVRLPLRSSDPNEGRLIDPATGVKDTDNLVTLTFTQANFATPQTVTVQGQDDLVRDGNVDYVIITDTATGTDTRYNLDPADVNATNIDNETPGIIVTPVAGLRTTEAGGTAKFTVRLSSPPRNPVRVPLRTSDATEGLISTNTQTTPKASYGLVFTTTDFNVPQTVTITGQDDSIDDGDISYVIITDPAVSTDTDYSGLNASNVSVRNTDNENPEIRVSLTSLTTNENSGTATFTVVLVAQPTADVTIPVSSSDTGEGTVFPASLTFTTANYNTPQTVVITVIDDAVDDGNVTYNVLLGPATSTDTAYNGLSRQVSVTNVDNDTAGIQVTAAAGLTTTEAGGTATFTVVLTSQPTQNVTVKLTSSDTTEGTVLPASLIFNALNYNTPRTVTVTGKDDALDDGSVPYNITVGPAVSADTKYNNLSGTSVALTNTDNDTRGVTITPVRGLRTTEARGTATFTVVLTAQPSADVRIPLRSTDISEGKPTVSGVTFTAANYATPQTVTIVGVNDFVDDGNVNYQITTLGAVSTDTAYKGFNAADVSVTNIDDDVAGIIVTPTTTLTTTEDEGTATFTIRLASQPTTNVTIDLSSNDTTEGTVAPTRIIFTPDVPAAGSPTNKVRYDTPFVVTVKGVDDSIEDGDVVYRILIGVTPSTTATTDPSYTSLSVPDVIVRNLDNDDKTAPLLAITDPENGRAYKSISKVTGTVSDPSNPNRFVSGVNTVQIRLRRLDNPSTAQNEDGFYNPNTRQYEATQSPAQLITASYDPATGTFARIFQPAERRPALPKVNTK